MHRWYRAPEVLLDAAAAYGPPVDVWAAGCVVGEMVNGSSPIFAGASSVSQLDMILDLVVPTPGEVQKMGGSALPLVAGWQREKAAMLTTRSDPWAAKFPKAEEALRDFLRRTLVFGPDG